MNLKKKIAEYQNFPKKGILFRDFSPILNNPAAMSFVVEEFSKKITKNHPIVEDSYIQISDLPGLGTEIIEENLTFIENNSKRDFGNLI